MERLMLSRILLARKDYRNAMEVANVFDAAWPSVYMLYLPASLEVRARAAEGIENRQLAAQFRNRLAGLRSGRVVAGN